MYKKLSAFIVIMSGLFIFSSSAYAQGVTDADLALDDELSVETAPTTAPVEEIAAEPEPIKSDYAGDVIIETPEDWTLPYRERRQTFGLILSVNQEKYFPGNFFSTVQNEYYDVFLNSDIQIVGGEIGIKYNFKFGSLAALFGYGTGTISEPKSQVDNITVGITKAALNLSLDTIFSEPYIVPFAQIGIHKIDWSETKVASGVTTEENFSTEPNYHYKAGVSFQLNWIEKKIDPSANDAYGRSSLENTYLDVFYTSYASPSKIAEAVGEEGEGDTASDAYGVGLKLEF